MKRKRSLKLFNNLCCVVGKIVVFTGVFCGLFFLINLVVTTLEPYVLSATNFCMSNIRWVMIGVSIVVLLILGFMHIIDTIKNRGVVDNIDSSETISD